METFFPKTFYPLPIRVLYSKTNSKGCVSQLAAKTGKLLGRQLQIGDIEHNRLGLGLPGSDRKALIEMTEFAKEVMYIGISQEEMNKLMDVHEASFVSEMIEIIRAVTKAKPFCTPKWLLGFNCNNLENTKTFYLKRPIPVESAKALSYRKWSSVEMWEFMLHSLVPIVDDFMSGQGIYAFANPRYSRRNVDETGLAKLGWCCQKNGFERKLFIKMRNVSELKKQIEISWCGGFYKHESNIGYLNIRDEGDFKKLKKEFIICLKAFAARFSETA
jgi:hypothetical protein